MPRHRRGSGSIYRRGNVWWLSYYVDGRNVCESSGTKDKAEARKVLQQRVGQIAEGRFVGPGADKVTFDELAQDVLNDYQINEKKSLCDAERSINALKEVFGGRRAQSITSGDVTRYVAARQAAELSNASINRELSALRRMFNLGLRNGRIVRKPHISMLEENNIRQGFFEWEDFDKVRKELPEYLKAPMTFAYLTGWRVRSEVLKLCWRNVDFEAGTVRLEPGTTKNKDGRLIYMTAQLKAVLDEQRKKTAALQRRSGQIINLVFHNKGKPIVNYYKAWHKACEAAKLSGRIPHDFRRTAVRNMIRAGIPERVAMQLTGHKTRAVFDRYHIVSDGDLREAALKLSGLDLTTFLTTLATQSKPGSAQALDFSARATLAQSVEQLIRNQ